MKLSLQSETVPNLNAVLCFLLGVGLTVFGLDIILHSTLVHNFLVALSPVGRTATFLTLPLIAILILSRSTTADGRRAALVDSPVAAVCVLFIIVWLSFLPALASWATADSFVYSIGGILQTKDAAAYISGAEQLLETGEFGQWNQRRPLNTTLLSSRMILGGGDFRNTLLLQAGLFGLSVFFVIYLVWQQLGATSAALMFLLTLSFSAYYLPTTLSESLGISLGLMALAYFLISIRLEKRLYYYLGLFVITLALLTRTGPMFVIPLYILYAGYLYSGSRRYRIKEAAFAVVPVIAAIVLIKALNIFYGDGSSGASGGFHYVLYNIVVGGNHWEQARFDYADEFKNLNSLAFSKLIYSRSFELILSEPINILSRYFNLLLIDGKRFVYSLYGNYMSLAYPGSDLKFIASFFSLTNEEVSSVKKLMISLLGLIFSVSIVYGLIQIIRSARNQHIIHISMIGVVGLVLSIPLLLSFAGLRVFIVVMPFLILFFILTLISIRRSERIITPHVNISSNLKGIRVALNSLLLAILFFAVIMPALPHKVSGIKKFKVSSEINSFSCLSTDSADHIEKIVMWLSPGIQHIEIISDKDEVVTYAPRIRESDFVLGSQHERRLRNVEMKAGTVIFSGYDLLSGRRVYMAATENILDGETGYRIICARKNSEKGRFPWFVTSHKRI